MLRLQLRFTRDRLNRRVGRFDLARSIGSDWAEVRALVIIEPFGALMDPAPCAESWFSFIFSWALTAPLLAGSDRLLLSD
jgi:hypothetical protein